MDYKELISRLRYCRVASEDIAEAATAIENLLAEREALLDALEIVSDCTSCKFYEGEHTECNECGDRTRNWRWCGLRKEA